MLEAIGEFVKAHQGFTSPIVFVLAFGESIAVLSLFVPATALVAMVGGLAIAGQIDLFPIWVAASLGAIAGDWLSFWLGRQYGNKTFELWPLSKYPGMFDKGKAFIEKWGFIGVFMGRFLGPLRATVPLIAGVCQMPIVPFQTANVLSGMLWALAVLYSGAFGVHLFNYLS